MKSARPPGGKRELEEVERALAVLGGRHPDAVRLERETQEAAAKRRAEAAVLGKVESKQRAKQAAIAAVVLAVVAGIAWKAHAIYADHVAAVARLVGPAGPYIEAGFGGRVDGSLLHPEHAEADVEGGTCVVALSAGANGPSDLVIDRDGEETKGQGSIAWCSCAREHVSAQAAGGATTLLRYDAATFAGTYGFARAHLAPKTLLTSPCADEHLDAWLTRGERRPAAGEAVDDAAWLAGSPARPALVSAGFHAVAHAPAGLPFAVAELPKETCALAFATSGTTLSLRGPGAPKAARAKGPLAFCTAKGGAFTIWPEPATEVTVIASSARRAGGLLGLGEIAARAKLDVAGTWVDDLEWDGVTAARASGIPDPTPVKDYSSLERPDLHDARVVSVSLSGGSTVTPDATKDLFFYACARDPKTTTQNLCVQDAQMRWRDVGAKGRSAGAESPLPFWLQSLAGVHDPDLVRAELSLFALARRLTSQGFDPTVLEAVTELPQGVDVKGRAGEDAVVVFTLAPHAPFATPCTDGPAWRLDGEPRIIPLEAGQHVVLKPLVPSSVPPNVRRTVVFRRSAKPLAK